MRTVSESGFRHALLVRSREELLKVCSPAEEDRSRFFQECIDSKDLDRLKFYLVRTVLHHRREFPLLFSLGSYVPLAMEGERADHLFGFLRTHENQTALILVPRLVVTLSPGMDRLPIKPEFWGETRLLLPEADARHTWRNLLTGETISGEATGLVRDWLVTLPFGMWVRAFEG